VYRCPYYTKATNATTSYCTEVYKYNTTKAPESTTHAAPIHYSDALKYYSAPSYYTTKGTEQDCACCPILLHQGSQVLLCSQLLIAPIFLNTTLFSSATPRLMLITPPNRSNTTPKRQSTSLPRSTQPQLRRPRMTQSRLTTQKLPFRATLNRNTTLMLQSTTPRPTLHRSPEVLHRRSCLIPNNVCCLVNYTEAPKWNITKALEFYTSMYAVLPTTPRRRITTTLKRSSTALQPTLPRATTPTLPQATTPTSRSITVLKRSRLEKKKSCPNCSAPCVTNCIPHRVTNSPLWVNSFIFEFCINSIFYLLIYLLIFNINANLFNV
jgi:hypothetical protein